MSLHFRVFNCDRTYNLDKVENLIKKVRPQASVDKEYFPLPHMSELCDKLKAEEKFSGYMVFVVHAHESRLSLNEQNAGIGYAKLYRTLLEISDNRVLIVIGGDNNYKSDEHQRAFLSQWAWRKISSQFTDDFLDGTTSFIFSWNKEHQPIHEEALNFYLDPQKPRKTFVPTEPKPDREPSPTPSTEDNKWKTNSLQDDSKESEILHQHSTKPEVGPVQSSTHDQKAVRHKVHYTGSDSTHISASSEGYESQSCSNSEPRQYSFSSKHYTDATPERNKHADDVTNKMTKQHKRTSQEYDSHQPMACPSVQVLSVLSTREDILRSSVLDVLAKALRSCSPTAPCGPYVPDVQPQHLPRHVEGTKPDFVVLVSEYDDFCQVKKRRDVKHQFRELFHSVNHLGKTKMIFVVTNDINYKGDDVTPKVRKKLKKINKEHKKPKRILEDDNLITLSWSTSPNECHGNVLKHVFDSCDPKPLQTMPFMLHRQDADRGLLKYRAVVQNGCILAVLHCDPFYWEPAKEWMRGILEDHHERTTIELWEDNSGKISSNVKLSSLLAKLLDVGPEEEQYALQVYSYDCRGQAYTSVERFFWKLGFSTKSTEISEHTMFETIQQNPTDYVAFVLDLPLLMKEDELEEMIRKHLPRVKPIIGKLKGIILIVAGDQNNRKRKLVASPEVLQRIDTLTALLHEQISESNNEIAVLSWNWNTHKRHRKTLQRLLRKRTISPAVARKTQLPRKTQTCPSPEPQNPVKYKAKGGRHNGCLRYRAKLVNGRLSEVKVCEPPDWKPDQRDLDFLADKHKDTPKAILEYWGDTYDKPPGAPVVTVKHPSFRAKLRSSYSKGSSKKVLKQPNEYETPL